MKLLKLSAPPRKCAHVFSKSLWSVVGCAFQRVSESPIRSALSRVCSQRLPLGIKLREQPRGLV